MPRVKETASMIDIGEWLAEIGLLLGNLLHDIHFKARSRRSFGHCGEVLGLNRIFVGKSGTTCKFRRSHGLFVSLI